MKTVIVKYINGQHAIRKVSLLETEADLDAAVKAGEINPLMENGMRSYLKQGEKVIINQAGGYCGAEGVVEFVKETDIQKVAINSLIAELNEFIGRVEDGKEIRYKDLERARKTIFAAEDL